jgi:glycosyltransferase involved in cell wall biosynthesis
LLAFRGMAQSWFPVSENRIGVSVVVPVRNEADSVWLLLDALRGQTLPPREIVITDGGSKDGTVEIVEEFIKGGAPVKLIREEGALPGRGRNLGAQQARCEWVAFTDAGTRPGENWLAALAERCEKEPSVDVVYGAYEPIVDSFFKECAAIAYVPPRHRAQAGFLRPPSIASALMRRRVWEAVGGFPEDLRSAEDLLFMEKIEKAGFHIAREPQAVVYWNIQPTLWRTFKRFATYSRWNIRAGLWRRWQAAIFRRYALVLVLALPAFVFGWRWVFATLAFWLAVVVARGVMSLRRNRDGQKAGIGRDALRLLWLVPIIATLDAAAFAGTIVWLIVDQ